MSDKVIDNLYKALEIMGLGMLRIFTVIIIIMLIVMFLAWITNLKGKDKNKKADSSNIQ